MTNLTKNAFARHTGRNKQRTIGRSGRRAAGAGVPSGAALFVCLFLSLVLIVLSKLDHGIVRHIRTIASTNVLAPLAIYTAQPAQAIKRLQRSFASHMTNVDEVTRLRQKFLELQQWKWRATQLELQLDQYRALLNGTKEYGSQIVSGRIMTDATSPFSHTVLVNLGTDQSIGNGFAVVNANGLLGRLIDTGRTTARVLLVTDLNSRIPIHIGLNRHRAMLVGNNDTRPRIEFLARETKLQSGDIIYTSGFGGIFPPGLRVGEIHLVDGKPRVQLNAGIANTDYISVLTFAPTQPPGGQRPAMARSRLGSKPRGFIRQSSSQEK